MHEITETDGLVLHREPAWHGLGVVVRDAPTPTEALQLAGLDYRIDAWPLTAFGPTGDVKPLDNYVANVRSDTHEPLGVVSTSYRVIQNRDVAEFAESLAEMDDVVKVESAGSIRGGKKVFFLLKGDSFSVRSDDAVEPYILLSNSHDGTNAFRATPTTIRVVCSNTLHMVIPERESGGLKVPTYTIRHTGDIKQRIDECKAALKIYGRSLDNTRQTFDQLADTGVRREQLQAFWLDVYQRLHDPVPVAPETKKEKQKRRRAEQALGQIAERFDRERDLAGASAWNAVNAFTGWAQNDRTFRGKDNDAREDSRNHMRMFGQIADVSNYALEAAQTAFA